MKIKVCMKINSQKDNAKNQNLGLFEVKKGCKRTEILITQRVY
jgi:hypothetical protein